jgi:hypothetical protein
MDRIKAKAFLQQYRASLTGVGFGEQVWRLVAKHGWNRFDNLK